MIEYLTMDKGIDILQIIFADIILSGDNALVIGMAAAGLPAQQRRQAIILGMALAAGLRIFFAAIATTLIDTPGILFMGGLLLCWVCWRFWCELRDHLPEQQAAAQFAADGSTVVAGGPTSSDKTLFGALVTITIADISMSIDNVLAVAAIAREDTSILIFGLALAIIFMTLCATVIMRVLTRHPWLSYMGLIFLVYLSIHMLWDGWSSFANLVGFGGSA